VIFRSHDDGDSVHPRSVLHDQLLFQSTHLGVAEGIQKAATEKPQGGKRPKERPHPWAQGELPIHAHRPQERWMQSLQCDGHRATGLRNVDIANRNVLPADHRYPACLCRAVDHRRFDDDIPARPGVGSRELFAVRHHSNAVVTRSFGRRVFSCPSLAPADMRIPSARVSRTVTRSRRKFLPAMKTPAEAEPLTTTSLITAPRPPTTSLCWSVP
jgi:hypothetical protein